MPRENAAAKALTNKIENALKYMSTDEVMDMWLHQAEVTRIKDSQLQVAIPTGNHRRYFTVKITENM